MFGIEDEMIELLKTGVNNLIDKKTAKEYAIFCVMCERENLKLITLEDYISFFKKKGVEDYKMFLNKKQAEIVKEFLKSTK